MSCDAFHLFPKLPAELRLKIWEFTFPGPRVLEVIWFQKEWLCSTESRHRPTFAPFANREANELFLEKWSRVTLRQVAIVSENPILPAVSYFNPQIDTLYIGATQSNASVKLDIISALAGMDFASSTRFLAYEIREWYNSEGEQEDWELVLLAKFPKLETLIIVDYDIDWTYLSEGRGRVVGEIELVSPTQVDMKSELEMVPGMLKRIAELAKSHPEANVPSATVQEVLRGGVRMEYT